MFATVSNREAVVDAEDLWKRDERLREDRKDGRLSAASWNAHEIPQSSASDCQEQRGRC
jgi:hypothetical protein